MAPVALGCKVYACNPHCDASLHIGYYVNAPMGYVSRSRVVLLANKPLYGSVVLTIRPGCSCGVTMGGKTGALCRIKPGLLSYSAQYAV